MNVPSLCYTKTCHTLEAVNAVAKGIRSTGSTADMVSVQDFAGRLDEYDALVVGNLCRGGVAGAGMAIPIERALARLALRVLAGKPCGAVSAHSGAGAESRVRITGVRP